MPEGISPCSTSTIVLPSAAGLSATWMPAARIASIFAAAVSRPPEMTAPAWPMRRPGGAVAPAMKPDGRLLHLVARQELGGVDFALAADLADHDDLLRSPVGQEHLQHLDEVGALHRIAADADAGALAQPHRCGLRHRLIGQRAGARHDADAAAAMDVARHDADLARVRA